MNRTYSNVVLSVLLQVVAIICGFVTPRLILSTFGSEVNGLVNSITQFLNYVMLFEGGLNAVVLAGLYKPIHDGNRAKIDAIISASTRFYNRLAMLFAGYTLIISLLYPIIVKTGFSISYIASLTWILSIYMMAQYCFALTARTYLKAEQKVGFVSVVQMIVIILNTLLTVVTIKLWPNIHIVKFVSSLVFVLQPIIFNRYIDKHYHINRKAEPDSKALEQRWSGFGINCAAFIHDNTDIVVLSIFSTLSNISIYSVYFLVTTGLKRLIQSISAGIVPKLGNVFASGDKLRIDDTFSLYEFIITFATFFLFIVGGLTITPFVLLYTTGIDDADYNQAVLGWFMIASEGIFCLREPYVNMAYSANRFKNIQKYAYIEAVLNVGVSLMLVKPYGFVGVVCGTIVGMSFRTLMQIVYLKKHVLHRSYKPVVKNLLLFFGGALFTIAVSRQFLPTCQVGIGNWLIFAMKNAIIALLVYSTIAFVFYRKQITTITSIIFNRKK